jgi:5-methyltetrahydropteroyltriglutamate--homocysteine methyltransferase
MLDTTNAGSLPKPEWLAEPEKLWAVWRFDCKTLFRMKDLEFGVDQLVL